MAEIKCEVSHGDVTEGDQTREGVTVTCGECGHKVQSFGTTERSIRRCFFLLKEECPRGENNFYVGDD